MNRRFPIVVASLAASLILVGCDEKSAEKKMEETAAAAEKKAESIVAGAMDAGTKAADKVGEAAQKVEEKVGEAAQKVEEKVEDAGLAAQGQKLVADLTAAIEKKDLAALPALLKNAEDLKAKLPADVQKTINDLITKGKAMLPAVPGM